MRAIVKWTVFPLGTIALACVGEQREPAESALSADLRQDLQLASATSLDLASAAQTFEPTRVVSAIEKVPTGKVRTPTSKAPKPRRAAPRQPVRVPAPEPAAEVGDAEPAEELSTVAVASEPVPEADPAAPEAPEEIAPADEPAAEPRPAPRPTPVPVSYPGPDERGRGGEGGGIIGVVIRGGRGGIDHCDERDVGRHPIPIAINVRFPGGGSYPGGQPTFPRRW